MKPKNQEQLNTAIEIVAHILRDENFTLTRLSRALVQLLEARDFALKTESDQHHTTNA
jgi:hypothetical protein